MRISFDFDDDSTAFEVLDAAFLGMLERELKSTQGFLDNDGWKHPDDVKVWKKQAKALKYLITLYGGYGYEDGSK